jgi:hypothetical protein
VCSIEVSILTPKAEAERPASLSGRAAPQGCRLPYNGQARGLPRGSRADLKIEAAVNHHNHPVTCDWPGALAAAGSLREKRKIDFPAGPGRQKKLNFK